MRPKSSEVLGAEMKITGSDATSYAITDGVAVLSCVHGDGLGLEQLKNLIGVRGVFSI